MLILAFQHWLYITIDFEILMFSFKVRLGLAPDYITDLLTPYVPECLRSSGRGLLEIYRSRLKTREDRALFVLL